MNISNYYRYPFSFRVTIVFMKLPLKDSHFVCMYQYVNTAKDRVKCIIDVLNAPIL